jgi:hypothetical protein
MERTSKVSVRICLLTFLVESDGNQRKQENLSEAELVSNI